jgi:hypothetical protein
VSSGAASRRKGLAGEREVAREFELSGWDVRGLEGEGDWLVFRQIAWRRRTLHLEVKRAELLKIPQWWRQAEAEAPPGVPPVLVFRRSNEPWRVVLNLTDFLYLVG